MSGDSSTKSELVAEIGEARARIRQLEAEMERFRALVESSSDFIWEVDAKGRYLYASPQIERIAGYAPAELLGRSVFDFMPEEEASRVRASFEAAVERGAPIVSLEHVMVRKDGTRAVLESSGVPIRDPNGKTSGYRGVDREITVRRRDTEAIEKRFLALTRPLDDDTPPTFDELFDLGEIQKLQDEFAAAAGVASIITRPDGTPITRPSSFCRLCIDIIRGTEKGRANCFKSDAVLGRHNPDGPTVQPCMSGGLWDAGAAISVGGRHFANWLIGQVRDATQREETIRAYAREIGADEAEAAAAFREVPSMSREQFELVARALHTLAGQLSNTAYQNVQQARFIAERQAAEEALVAVNRRMTLAADSAGIGIWDFNVREGTLTWDDWMYRLYGVDRANFHVTYESWKQCLHPGDRSRATEDVERTMQGDLAFDTEFRILRPDGRVRCIKANAIVLAGDDGRPLRMIGTNYDITDQKTAERDLKVSLDQQTAVFDCSMVGIMVLHSGVVTRVNRRMAEMLGYGPEELHGRGTERLYLSHDAFLEFGERYYWRLAEREVEDVEYPLRHKDGRTVWCRFSGRAIEPPDLSRGAVWVVDDITERKHAERERERLQEQLMHAQKMESVGRLAGGVAHDFNNLLTGIIGNLSLAMEDMGKDDPLAETLGDVVKAANSASELTRQLLAFSRKQLIQPKVIDLNDLIDSIRKMLVRLIGEDVELAVQLQPRLGRVRADPGQVEQVIVNLVVNARDAMPRGGTLTISTRDAVVEEGDGELAAGDYVRLSVTDDGEGMDEVTRLRAFEPFFTTKRGAGTGLGLATVYGIVKQHQGGILVHSQLGRGSTFDVLLPTVEEEAESCRRDSGVLELPRGAERVLIVEDEPSVRAITIRMLERQGYQVVSAASGAEALELVQRMPERIDLLVTDIVMPKMNGRELAIVLQSLRPTIRVLYTSGYTEDVIAHHGVLDEGVHFLAKPFTPAQLAIKIRDVLDSEA